MNYMSMPVKHTNVPLCKNNLHFMSYFIHLTPLWCFVFNHDFVELDNDFKN